MIRKSTRWDRKERINVESDLKVLASSSQSAYLTFSGNFLQNDFCISFIVDKDNGNTTQNLFELNDLSNTSQFLIQLKDNFLSIRLRNDTGTQKIVNTAPKILDNQKKTIVLQREGAEFWAYLNGKKEIDLSLALDLVGDYDFSNAELRIGGDLVFYPSFSFTGNISHFQIFDNSLTQQEISYIHIQGGLIPESAHESCVAHYPLTQRQYFKASADFIIKHPQFALNNLIALDVVEQYNYAKAIPLTANHGELINFTDAEVGNPNTTNASSIKDFHTKGVNQANGLGDGQLKTSNALFHTLLPANNDFTIFAKAKFNITALGTTNTLVLCAGAARLYLSAIHIFDGTLKQINLQCTTTTFGGALIIDKDLNNIGEVVLMASWNLATTTSRIRAYFKGKLLGEFTNTDPAQTWVWVSTGGKAWWIRGNPFGASTAVLANETAILENAIYNTTLSDVDIDDIIAKDNIFEKAYLRGWRFNNTDGVDVIELGGNATEDMIAGNANPNWIEKNSLLPEIRQAWKGLDNIDYISLPLQPFKDVANSDFTIAITMWMDRTVPFTQRIFSTFGGTNGNLAIYNNSSFIINFGLLSPNVISSGDVKTIPESWQTIFFTKKGNAFKVGPSNADTEIFVSSSVEKPDNNVIISGEEIVDWSTLTEVRGYDDNGYCARIGLWNRVLSEKEMKELGNNNIFKNPTIEQQKDLKGYWLFNEVIDNLGVAEFKDYSSNEENATVIGQTVLEAEAALIDINELR